MMIKASSATQGTGTSRVFSTRASSHYSKELIDERVTQILALLLYIKKQDNNQFTVLSLPCIETEIIKLTSKQSRDRLWFNAAP